MINKPDLCSSDVIFRSQNRGFTAHMKLLSWQQRGSHSTVAEFTNWQTAVLLDGIEHGLLLLRLIMTLHSRSEASFRASAHIYQGEESPRSSAELRSAKDKL